jgi:hypothetical protein
VRSVLAAILFVFEPFLAASLLLRIGPTLLERDAATFVALAVRVALALTSVAAAIGLRASRPYADRLTLAVLFSSAAFAAVQYFTHVLPTSVPPDIAPVLTGLLVLHHSFWIALLVWSGRRR